MNGLRGALITGVLIGLVAGVPAGMLASGVRRSWAEVSAAKSTVAKVRKTGWSRTREAAFLCFWLAVAVAVAIGLVTERQQ